MSIRTLMAIVLATFFQFILASVSTAASLALSASSGPPMTTLTLTGSGFAKNTIVDVYFDLSQKAFRLTTSRGTLSLKLRVPSTATPGEHMISVIPHSGSGASAQKAFTVQSSWTQRRLGASGQAWNQYENLLDAGSVRAMSTRWDLGGAVGSELYVTPLVVGSRVYVLTGDKRLKAYSLVTRAKLFDVAANGERITQPTYGNGNVYVAGEGKLSAYNGTSGALVWKATLPRGVGGPVVRNGIVYVVARGSVDAGLFAFSVTCGRAGATCRPLWQWRGGSTSGYSYPETSVAVSGRYVFAVIDKVLYQFPLTCRAAVCNPLYNTPNVDSTAPSVSDGIVYVTKSDMTVHALPEACIACGALWTGTLTERTTRDITVANGMIFLASSARLYAFSTGCDGATCSPVWSTRLPSSGYAVAAAGSLVYALTAKQLLVFPMSCYTGCPSLWRSGFGATYSNVNYASVAVVDGAVYSASADGMKVYALPESPVTRRGTRASRDTVRLDQLKPSVEFAAAEAALEQRLEAAR